MNFFMREQKQTRRQVNEGGFLILDLLFLIDQEPSVRNQVAGPEAGVPSARTGASKGRSGRNYAGKITGFYAMFHDFTHFYAQIRAVFTRFYAFLRVRPIFRREFGFPSPPQARCPSGLFACAKRYGLLREKSAKVREVSRKFAQIRAVILLPKPATS